MSEETLEEIKYYSEMYPDGIHKKSQAKEMFEELGYEYRIDEHKFIIYEHKYKIKEIRFDEMFKVFIICGSNIINDKELKAINKQVEELWGDEILKKNGNK